MLGERVRTWVPKATCWLVLAVVFSVLLGMAGCDTQVPRRSVAAHPEVAPGVECSSCKAPKHDYVHRAPYLGDCVQCHELRSWTWTEYRHKNAEMNLGFHGIIGCPFCHTEGDPLPSPECGECHQPPHDPLPTCGVCHSPLSWTEPKPVPKGHVSFENGHSELTCFSCHKGKNAFTAPVQCVACHGFHHGGLTDCFTCHDPSLHWKPKPGFSHNRFFKLTGKHKTLRCEKCHRGNTFGRLRPTCSACHGTRHGGFTDCSRCHTTSGFVPSTFRHWRVFTLTGAHARLRCSKCHPRNAYASVKGGGSTACVSCHGARHGGLRNCSRCHTTRSFTPSTFRHSSVWRLTGEHTSVPCRKCHPRSRYADVIGSPSRCTNCHGKAHGGLTRCETCHSTKGFVPAKRIAHPVPPALGGEHAVRSCRLCHPTLVFSSPTKPCSDCHTAPHVGPTDCLRCHRPTVWSEVYFYTHSEIGYHTGIPFEDACIYCHTTGDFTQYTCTECHLPF